MEVREAEDAYEKLLKWEREQLEAYGFSKATARRLSRVPHFTHHDAKRLLDAGCPLATAARILRPIE